MRTPLAALAVAAGAVALVSFLRGRAEINRHVDAYRAHWEERVDGGDSVLHYVALGDSAAQGVGASSVAHGYVALLARRIAERTGREVVVTNLSVSGATSADVVRDQLPLLRDLHFTPDLVTLDIGANDVVFPGHTPSTFEANLDVILEALPEGAFVADVPWFMVPVPSTFEANLDVILEALPEGAFVADVPLHTVTRETGTFGYHRYTARDLFHPNDLGYEGWADTFWATIEASGVLTGLGAAASNR